MAISEKGLRSITSLEEVVALLSNELDWPLNAENIEQITFAFTAEELGANANLQRNVNSIRQLRPFTKDQPWGIFLLDLSGATLLKKNIRDMLKALTKISRGKPNSGTWSKENLLFIVSSGSEPSFQIHFLTFQNIDGEKTEIRTIDWGTEASPPQKLRRLSRELLPKLCWPTGSEDPERWLSTWRSAFSVPLGSAIQDASSLATRMAQVASRLRSSIEISLNKENGNGPLSRLLDSIRIEIDSEADPASFADMCAQTITYGLLSSRVQDPEGFNISPVMDSFPLNNAFLEALFAEVQDAIGLDPQDQQSIEALAADLASTNVEAILDEFGNTADGGDPVIHFYERFLFMYDREIRMAAGAFYTPKPVVDAMVRLVDSLLISKFGLSRGLADSSTWQEVCSYLGIPVPDDRQSDAPFLSILDPATGTGTYLVSIIEQMKTNLETAGMDSQAIDAYFNGDAVPHLTAFELMLGPYSIANLKLGLTHQQEQASYAKTVFLTNTLDLNAASHQLFAEESALSNEGEAALERKLYEPFTVIIGNPPYGRDTQTDGSAREAGDRTGGVMRHKSDHFEYPPIQDFLSTLEEAGVPKRRGAQVYNLYAYFWRWSIWQTLQKDISRSGMGPHATETKNPGIVAFITSASFIRADSFAGMRDYLRGAFDEIFVIDLGGSSLIGGRDPNIFPIQTPVAICIGIRTKGRSEDETLADVKYVRIEGTREQKLQTLSALNLEEISNGGQGRFDSFAKEPETILSTMDDLDSYFDDVSSACLPGRTWVVSPSKDTLRNRWGLLLAETDTVLKNKLLKANSGRTIYSTPRPFSDKGGLPLTSLSALNKASAPEGIIRYSYRPYDNQWLISDMRLIGQPSKFRFVRHEAQFWLGSGQNLTHGPSVIAYKNIPDFDAFRGFGGGKDFFPAFSNPTDGVYNLSDKALEYLNLLGMANDELGFLEYIYAIHGSGAYTEAFASELRLGTSRAKLPITADKKLFRKLSQIGSKLLNQHLSTSLDPIQIFSPETFEAKPAKVADCPGNVTYDTTSQQVLFDGKPYCAIPSEIWTFSVGTMKVVQAFLKNRQSQPRGRRSSPLDDVNDTKWIYNDEFVKMIADVSAVIEAKKVVMPLLMQIVEELKAQPGR
jgi:hypothetical protein